jgi:hypothetical protein
MVELGVLAIIYLLVGALCVLGQSDPLNVRQKLLYVLAWPFVGM